MAEQDSPTVVDEFRPARWLPGPHLQTLWASLLRPWPRIRVARERVEMPDGDFIDLDWSQSPVPLAEDAPLVLVIHGLEGSLRSRYAAGLLRTLTKQGTRAVLMNLRGCSGERNRLARRYHSGETGDLAYIVKLLQQRFPGRPLAAVGYSLGGNMLLKWLGETGTDNPLSTAVAVSVPFELGRAAQRLKQGFSRLYAWALLRSLKRSTRDKFGHVELPFSGTQLAQTRDFWEFDDLVTAPLHGFASADDYYQRCSSRQFLKGIKIPTLVLQSLDDPFLYRDALPRADEVSSQVQLELTPGGGHVGFVGGLPWAPRYWLEERIPAWLRQRL